MHAHKCPHALHRLAALVLRHHSLHVTMSVCLHPPRTAAPPCLSSQVKMMVQPGNEGMCLPTSGTIRVEPKRAPHIPVLYTRQVCSATPGQATYCSTQPATLPVCGDQPAGKQLRWASSHGSAVAGGLAVAAGGVFAVAAAAAAVGLRRRCCRRRRRAVQTSSNWDAELANLLPHPGFQQQQQQQAGIAVTAAGSKPPSTRSGGSSKGAGSASSADGSGERLGPRSSWHLHSRSLQLQADDFQILLDKSGRPDLLGSGASSRVGNVVHVHAVQLLSLRTCGGFPCKPSCPPPPTGAHASLRMHRSALQHTTCTSTQHHTSSRPPTRRCTAACCTARSRLPSK